MGDERRFLAAIALSVGILLLWQLVFVPPPPDYEGGSAAPQQLQAGSQPNAPSLPRGGVAAPSPSPSPTVGGAAAQSSALSAPIAKPAAASVAIRTPDLLGNISAAGTTFDVLRLLQYRQGLAENTPPVELFSPSGSPGEYIAQFGWSSGDGITLPGGDSIWQPEASGDLNADTPLRLTWQNDAGVVVRRTITLSDGYLFSITDEIQNNSGRTISAAPWGLLYRQEPQLTDTIYILHEGPVGYFMEDGLVELDYDDLDVRGESYSSPAGWAGITDKYFAGILVPQQGKEFVARYSRRGADDNGHVVQVDYIGQSIAIASGASITHTQSLYAGPKLPRIIDEIETQRGIAGFDLVVDWGIFHFLTKPLMAGISYFYDIVGNYGVAILIVTVIVKIIFFPLAYKSYVAMSRMQKLQPQMLAIREQYSDDQAKMQKAMAQLYRDEKVNPAAGCLPILLQIPVFFSLYKVIYISIQLRHAPFFGWIQDLSAPDPTSIFNLFGLLPFSTPALLTVGIWPILMGVTMFLQMQLAPMQTINPMQKVIFRWLPLVFVFVLAPLPAGLIIYWVWNNILSIAQQAYIMKRNGAPIALLDNLREMFNRGSKDK